ncbi:MAG: iron-containing alcohol dehydrogenase [Desulfobulbaceae bacterium]|nr:MAG: iron-containing alcohol dehydrogenase [Desulfobulbaceae bacterium]
MIDFVYHNPVKILFGRKKLTLLATELKGLGKKPLIVCGQNHLFKNSVFEQINTLLSEADIPYHLFRGIQANPVLSKVYEGITQYRDQHCDCIIAIGGGSVIDTAKAISVGVVHDYDIWNLFLGKKSIQQTVPIITIPTTAGSGSEVNGGMVITNDFHNLKLGYAHRLLFPRICIADPSLTLSLPEKQTIDGMIDACIHCLEPYLSHQSDNIIFQPRLLELIIHSILKVGTSLRETPQSYHLRAEMLWLSGLAMNGLGTSGLGRVQFELHLLEHSLSALDSAISHGEGLASLLTGWLTFNSVRLSERIDRLNLCLIENQFQLPVRDNTNLIDYFNNLLSEFKAPRSISDIGITSKDIPRLVMHCMVQAKIWKMKHCHERYLADIFAACL